MAPPIFRQGNRATLTFPYCTGTPLPHTRPHALCLIHGHQSHVSHCRRDGRRRSKNHLSKQRARALTLASKRCPGEKADGHTCNLPSLWGRTRWSPRHPSLQAKQPLIAPLEAESHPWPWVISWRHLEKWPLKRSLHINVHSELCFELV